MENSKQEINEENVFMFTWLSMLQTYVVLGDLFFKLLFILTVYIHM